MHNFKKRISLLLLLGLVCTSVSFTSCASGDTDKGTTTQAASEQVQTTTDEKSGRLAIPDDLPSKDYEGKSFRVLVRDNNWATCRHIEEIVAESETGEVINDAVYNRNRTVEDRFNVKIEVVPQSEKDETTLTNFIRKTVLAGDDQFDLVSGHMILMGGLSTSDVYFNMYELPYVDFDKPWWLKSATEELTVDDKSFFGISHLGYNALDYTYCYYFNKSLAKDYGIDNIYQTVRDGKWTIDYLNSIVKDIYKDVDANDKKDDTDFFGLVTNAYSASVTYLWAFDNPVTKKDDEGLPKLVLNTPKMSSIVTKLNELYFDTDGVSATIQANNGYGGDWPIYAYTAFQNGKALFATGLFNDAIINYRNVDFDYGILPYPKWDEVQENYYTMMDGHGPLLAVPITISDPEFVSIILEAMSAEGYKIITPAYYDVALKTKYARDEETEEMLDLILEGRRFDFGYIYDNWNGMAFCLQNLLTAKKSDFTSYYEKNEAKALKFYDTVIKAYQDYGA